MIFPTASRTSTIFHVQLLCMCKLYFSPRGLRIRAKNYKNRGLCKRPNNDDDDADGDDDDDDDD